MRREVPSPPQAPKNFSNLASQRFHDDVEPPRRQPFDLSRNATGAAPTRPRRPRSATAVSAGANLQGSVRYNVERLQLAPASTERPQTKMGGISVAKRACGRLINKTAPLFSRLSPQRSFMRRKALAFVLRAAEENFEQRANWLICGRFVCVCEAHLLCPPSRLAASLSRPPRNNHSRTRYACQTHPNVRFAGRAAQRRANGEQGTRAGRCREGSPER